MARLVKEACETDEVEAKASLVRYQQQAEEMKAVCQAAPEDAVPPVDDQGPMLLILNKVRENEPITTDFDITIKSNKDQEREITEYILYRFKTTMHRLRPVSDIHAVGSTQTQV